MKCSHGVECERRGDCPSCVADVINGPPASSMSGTDRAAEVLRLLMTPTFATMAVIQARLEELVGRPVWTHEMAMPQALALDAISRTGDVDVDLVMDRLRAVAPDKPIIVVDVDPE